MTMASIFFFLLANNLPAVVLHRTLGRQLMGTLCFFFFPIEISNTTSIEVWLQLSNGCLLLDYFVSWHSKRLKNLFNTSSISSSTEWKNMSKLMFTDVSMCSIGCWRFRVHLCMIVTRPWLWSNCRRVCFYISRQSITSIFFILCFCRVDVKNNYRFLVCILVLCLLWLFTAAFLASRCLFFSIFCCADV